MNKFFYALGIISSIAVIVFLLVSGSDTEPHKYQKQFKKDYAIYALDIPKEMDFCGESVPLENVEVRERLDRELLVNTYWQSNALLFFKRSSRWFPVIEPILKANGVPDDLKYVALIESGLMHVTSPAGARSYWQFMKGAAKEYGLEINSEVDERYHVKKATEAACKYFKKSYNTFQSWTLAAASYNMGVAGVKWQLSKQDVTSFYDLYLNLETSRYIFRILAAKEILENPEKYGFHFKKYHLYQPYQTKTITVSESITDLYEFAKEQGVTYRELKVLNPWLRSTHLTISSGNSYEIELPLETKSNVLITPEEEKEPEEVEVAEKYSVHLHTVKRRESIYDIADLYGVKVSQIKQWNDLTDDKVKKGQQLKIYQKEEK